ncbi:MAG: fumarylacetoacetate hydrolase family protein [Rhodobacteraceae bacterium]|nr:fumarylacetoacetate hydrolase family protein [Paracoccaceae bacterium]MCY4196563.1 fumarylacetoacetate hydrolase family protein [Paracoccaceae bacterium]
MKLARIGPRGQEKPAILDADGNYRDLSTIINDINGATLADMSWADNLEMDSLPVFPDGKRIGPCVGGVGKIICVGLNYSDHAAETGAKIPREPILFGKATSSITGPYDNVIIPKGSEKTDWEVELGIVIGKPSSYVTEDDSLDHVAGYCVINDVSERSFQTERGGQWIKGKSADSFAPIGPWLVTRDEIADPQNLKMWLDIDGHRRQSGSTNTMIFGVKTLVSYISHFMSLQPGDIIPTGTPPGVGLGMKPPTFLRPGQVIELGIEGLGAQRQDVIAWTDGS